MHKRIFYLIIIAIIVISALILRITDNNGKWTCVKGEWVKQGKTSADKPSELCFDLKNIHDYDTCLQLDDFIWCGGIEKCIASTLSCASFTEEVEAKQDIEIVQPLEGELISSPYEIRGLVLGTWFFEADFEIQLLDQEGNILANTIATALDDWMTTNLVPFIANLEFETDYQGQATLLLIKDNPSGLKEHEEFFSLEIML
jgi:hypothetical protein